MGARLVFPGSRLVNTLEDGVFVECEPFTPLIVRARVQWLRWRDGQS